MKITILTLFPDMFVGPFDASIIKRTKEKGIVDISLVQIRDFATDAYKTVDDHPYGGGVGMILKVDVVDRAIENAKCQMLNAKCKTVLLTPQGRQYTQAKARELAKFDHLILLCGHYEGVDERIRNLVDEEISLGDYVLTGGEIPAMVLVDSVVRLLPNALKETATSSESFSFLTPSSDRPVLEYPQYTRPQIYKNMNVPDILLSGNHQKIKAWQEAQAIKRTKKRRPDLLSAKRGERSVKLP